MQKRDSLTGGYGTRVKACGPFMKHVPVFNKHVQYLKTLDVMLFPTLQSN